MFIRHKCVLPGYFAPKCRKQLHCVGAIAKQITEYQWEAMSVKLTSKTVAYNTCVMYLSDGH